jgi:hypothetical protein
MSEGAVEKFWAGAAGFAVLLFVLGWIGLNIYTGSAIARNPATAAIQAQKEKDERADKLKEDAQDAEQMIKAKEQYIEGCKKANKSPSDMGESKESWRCE